MSETLNKADIDGRSNRNENDRNIGRDGFGGDPTDRAPDNEQVDVGKQREDGGFHLVQIGSGKPGLQANVLAVDITKGGKSLLKSR